MDGSNAWAEIDAILASIDPNRASWISHLEAADHLEVSDSRGLLDFLVSLDDWAALNRLEDVAPALLAHGFDSASFINGVLSDSDLMELGMRSSNQRRRVLAAVQDLPLGVMAVAESLSSSTSLDWLLQRLCLSRQLGPDFFGECEALTVDDLAGVTDAGLRQKFNVRKLGHRRRILCCLDNAPALTLPQPRRQMPASASASQNGLHSHGRQSSNLSARSSVSSSAKSTSLAVAAASVTMATGSAVGGSASDDSSDGAHRMAAAPAVAHRPDRVPSLSSAASAASATLTELMPRRELLAGVSRSWVATGGGRGTDADDCDEPAATHGRRLLPLPRSRSTDFLDGSTDDRSALQATFKPLMRAGWPHQPDVLLKDSFSYSVSYLGFRPLVNHTDQTEISLVIQMFRCKSADILKLPRIRLTVCYRGVKFINPDNDMVITEHRITEIYFACQDNTRRANFAYVTKDSVNGVHYCHCFASHSPETAVLIIQTLSEACGLANQLIEFNQLRKARRQQRQHGGRNRSKRT